MNSHRRVDSSTTGIHRVRVGEDTFNLLGTTKCIDLDVDIHLDIPDIGYGYRYSLILDIDIEIASLFAWLVVIIVGVGVWMGLCDDGRWGWLGVACRLGNRS